MRERMEVRPTAHLRGRHHASAGPGAQVRPPQPGTCYSRASRGCVFPLSTSVTSVMEHLHVVRSWPKWTLDRCWPRSEREEEDSMTVM